MGLISCAAHGAGSVPRVDAQRPDVGAVVVSNERSAPAFDLADWLPGVEATPWVIERRDDRTLLVDGTLRAVLFGDGGVEVAQQRPQHAIVRVFAGRDGRWTFVSEDGLVTSSQEFLGPLVARADLPARVDAEHRVFRRGTGVVVDQQGACWALDAPSAPIRAGYPEMGPVIDAAYVDEAQALLVGSKGEVWLWRGAGVPLRRLEATGDVPAQIDASGRVRGAQTAWRLTGERLEAEPVTDDPSATSEELSADEHGQWSEWRRRAMFPFDQIWWPGSVVGSSVVSIDLDSESFVLRSQSGASIALGEFDALSGVQRYGAAIAAVRQSGAVRLIDAANGRVTDVDAPTGDEEARTLVAQDGSIIASVSDAARRVSVWNPSRGWSSRALDARVSLRHARSRRLYGDGEEGIVEVTPGEDGGASMRTVVRFASLGRPREDFATLVATSQHGAWRAWLFSAARPGACALVLEDGSQATSIDAPSCESETNVLFADSRFGIVETIDAVHVTRDGRTFSVRTRSLDDFARAFVAMLMRRVFVPVIVDGAILVWASDRIEREPARSSPVIRRSRPLPSLLNRPAP
jgi:hypothetical protein